MGSGVGSGEFIFVFGFCFSGGFWGVWEAGVIWWRLLPLSKVLRL